MKRFNFNIVGISILILLNLMTLSYLFYSNHRRGDKNKRGHMEMRVAMKNYHGKNFMKKTHFSHSPMKDLNLTEEQKNKFKELRASQKEIMLDLNKKMVVLKNKQETLLKENKLDSEQALLIANEFGQLEKDIQLAKMKHKLAIGNVLTSEQKEMYSKSKDQFKERRKKYNSSKEHCYRN